MELRTLERRGVSERSLNCGRAIKLSDIRFLFNKTWATSNLQRELGALETLKSRSTTSARRLSLYQPTSPDVAARLARLVI